MDGLVGLRVGVGRPIGKGKRIAIQASSSLLLPDPRMSAAKAALVRGGVGVSVRGVRVGVRDRIRVRVQVLVGSNVSVKVVEID